LLGVVHLPPLPGSPRGGKASLEEILAHARADVEALLEAGWDGYVVENFGDAPFFKGPVPSHVIAMLTRLALLLPSGKGPDGSNVLRGVNVLRNDAAGALAVAAAAELDFIRINVHVGAKVTDQGVIEGKAAETTRLRQVLGAPVELLADVAVKHAVPLGEAVNLGDEARETAYRGLADGLIVTGKATGSPTALADVRAVKEAVPDRPLFIGSGVTLDTVTELLTIADGVIVGTALKPGGHPDAPIDRARARDLARAVRG